MPEYCPKGASTLNRQLSFGLPELTIIASLDKKKQLSGKQVITSTVDEFRRAVEANRDKVLWIDIDSTLDAKDVFDFDGTGLRIQRFSGTAASSGDVAIVLRNLEAELVSIRGKTTSIETSTIKTLLIHLSPGTLHVCKTLVGCLQIGTGYRFWSGREVNLVDVRVLAVKSVTAEGALGLGELGLSKCRFELRAERRLQTNDVNKLSAVDLVFERQSYSDLYEWAVGSGNAKVAHEMRGLELSIDQMSSSGFERAVLTLWGVFSKFGLAPLRPFAFVAVAFAFFASLLYLSGTVPGAEVDALTGWREVLNESADASSDDVMRAVVGALEGVLSPLSVFSFRRLVIPVHFWASGVQIVYNYFVITMLFLSGFAIRRRFRVG